MRKAAKSHELLNRVGSGSVLATDDLRGTRERLVSDSVKPQLRCVDQLLRALSPAALVTAAERDDMRLRGDWIVARACSHASDWRSGRSEFEVQVRTRGLLYKANAAI
jgi:hypothetical protein